MTATDDADTGSNDATDSVDDTTTDDPTDSLEHHLAVAADPSIECKLLPAWRPDKAMAVEDLAAYRVAVREPVLGDYRGYRIVGAPPSSSAGLCASATSCSGSRTA